MRTRPSKPICPDMEEATADVAAKKQQSSAGPDSASAYLNPSYWDKRFAEEEHYEWLKDYSHFRHLLRRHLRPFQSILEIGCGSSRLSEALAEDGVSDITTSDISETAVEMTRRRLQAKGLKGINVMVADMLSLPFEDDHFDLVIEKGTMDVLFVDCGDPWNPRPSMVEKVMAMLKGVQRVLKPDGIFISISFGQPHFRRRFFEDPEFTWSFEYETFGEEFHYFFYTLKKGLKQADEADQNCEDKLTLPPIDYFHEELGKEDFIFRTCVEELNL
ncbi:S-adenosyl-L-methionine-dependent methyltransferases superfamily protein [Wolffia australiana]